MMHMMAFSQSQDEGGVLSYVTPVNDPATRVQGNDWIVPAEVSKILGGIAMVGTTGTQAQLLAPSLRRTNPYDFRPLVLGLTPLGMEPAYLHEDSPIPLDVNEALNCRILADPAAAEQQTVVVFMGDGTPTPTKGRIIKCRFTVTSIVTAGAFVNAQITFPDPLPTGLYKVIGSALVGSGLVAARWYPVGGKWRPGFPAHQTLADRQDGKFRNGGLGEWFTFDWVQPPSIDLLASASAGSATYTGTLDLLAA